MPFESSAQRRYLFAKHPEVAKEFAQHTTAKEEKRLPEHVSRDREEMKHPHHPRHGEKPPQ